MIINEEEGKVWIHLTTEMNWLQLSEEADADRSRSVERCASVGHGAQIFPHGEAAKWEQEKKKQEYSKGHWCVASARSCNSLKLKRRGKKGDWTCQHETQIKCFQHINHSSWSTLKQEFSSAAFHLLDVLVEKKKNSSSTQRCACF